MKFKDILTGIAISLFSTLLFFAVAEIAVRILYPGIIPSTKYDWSSRHKGYPLEKPENTFRIVVLGDSFTFGQGVKRDETFPKRLEHLLNKASAGTKFEVINLGFCGLNTGGEFEMLAERGINPDTWQPDGRYRGLAYSPDLIILEYTLNDSSTSGRSLEQIKQFDDKWRKGEVIIRLNSGPYSLPVPDLVDRLLTKYSRFYLFFLDRYNQILGRFGLRETGAGHIEATLNRYKDDFEGWQYSKQALREISYTCKREGIPAILAIYPEMVSLRQYPFRMPHEKIKNTAEGFGFHTVDLFSAFEGKDEKSLMVSPYDGHPNAKAHETAAFAILGYLKKRGTHSAEVGGRKWESF